MNEQARYQNPPLPTWITACSGALFGMKNLIATITCHVNSVFFGVGMYYLSIKLKLKKSFALVNALIAVTSFYVIAIPIEAPWDIYTHTFMLGGISFLFQFLEENKYQWENAIFSGIMVGFSILSKGPVSLFALFLPILIILFMVLLLLFGSPIMKAIPINENYNSIEKLA